MRAFIVCVDYADLLRVTLPYNRHHFSHIHIVTSPTDGDTHEFLLEQGLATDSWVTDAFYRNGAKFNKWLALEEALDWYGREGWICLMDADVLWPKEAEYKQEVGILQTPVRRMLTNPMQIAQMRNGYLPAEHSWKEYPLHRNLGEFAGYSQIFHADDPHLGKRPWHETNWEHAGGADSFFQRKWPPHKKIRPGFEVLHIGDAGANWYGRSTPYLDGTRHPEATARRDRVNAIWRDRRLRQRNGLDPFENEKIARPDTE